MEIEIDVEYEGIVYRLHIVEYFKDEDDVEILEGYVTNNHNIENDEQLFEILCEKFSDDILIAINNFEMEEDNYGLFCCSL